MSDDSPTPASAKPAPSDASHTTDRRTFGWLIVGLVTLLAGTLWVTLPQVSTAPLPQMARFSLDEADADGSEPIVPLPHQVATDPQKVALGRRLFHDPVLSQDNSIACSTCHDLTRGGTDHMMHSVGMGGATGPINTLGVFNSVFNVALFWDGRAATLEDQIDGPILNPAEMASTWTVVVAKLADNPAYVRDFTQLYPQGISEHTIKDAIAEFERSLVTPDSRFDRYLRGDSAAITPDEKRGYQLFKDYGCAACHQGRNVGGNMFQLFGVMADYFSERGNIGVADLGRFNVTGKSEDLHRFRVPSLRNVALTPPYFHDGSAPSLDQAVRVMAKYQLGRPIPEPDVQSIVAFLTTLTGVYDGEPL
jgi:cytochrome c peroxidase